MTGVPPDAGESTVTVDPEAVSTCTGVALVPEGVTELTAHDAADSPDGTTIDGGVPTT